MSVTDIVFGCFDCNAESVTACFHFSLIYDMSHHTEKSLSIV